jgi:lysozyme
LNTGVVKKQPKLEKMVHGGNDMKISLEGIALIKKFEGCKLESYLCAASVPTIGYGSTKGIEMGMEISQERAEELLLEDLVVYEDAVIKSVEVPLHQHQFDALVSWTFNLGGANLNASTMLKVLNKGAYKDVPYQIKRWNKAGGKVLEGLTRRRLAESLLFEGNDWEHI